MLAPCPPFDEESARVALAYTEDSVWRNRDEFITGRAEIEASRASTTSRLPRSSD